MSIKKQSQIPEDAKSTVNALDSDAETTGTTLPEDRNTGAQEPDTPNANQRVDVTVADLPLHCPMPGKRLWDSHPKVYLPIEDTGEEICPYCGTVYGMKGPVTPSH